MTEAEWFATEDVDAMLSRKVVNLSNRKLWLWVEACREFAEHHEHHEHHWPTPDSLARLPEAVEGWTRLECPKPSFRQRADLLRCICGNPFRPAKLERPKFWCTIAAWVASGHAAASLSNSPMIVSFQLPLFVIDACLREEPPSAYLHPVNGTINYEFRAASFTRLNQTMTDISLINAKTTFTERR